jgi:enoyl-CoA hydratase/carnithine racemase
MQSKIVLSRTGAVAWIAIDNPERHNAFSSDMFRDMGDLLLELDGDGDVRVVVIRGAGGKAFASGADISRFDAERSSPEQVAAYGKLADRMFDSARNLSKPTIAMIQGWCIGGGLNLALNCDIRICNERARFGIPASKLGLGYSLKNTSAVVEAVGPAAAREMLFSGRHLDAAEALRIGLVQHLVADPVEDFVAPYAEAIARNAPLTIRQMKRAIAEATRSAGERDELAIARLVDDCNASTDYVEGRRAFREKRPPEFRGR